MERIGVGWFSTISAAFLVAGTAGTMAAIRWGKGWRDEIDHKRREARLKDREAAREELRLRKYDEAGVEEMAPGQTLTSAGADAVIAATDLEKGTKMLEKDTKRQ